MEDFQITKDHATVIAVDIDGTLNDGDESKTIMIGRQLRIGISVVLMELVRDGYTVVLYTSRDISRKRETEEWLKRCNITREKYYHDIIYNKLKYDVILDDKALNPLIYFNEKPRFYHVGKISHLLETYCREK